MRSLGREAVWLAAADGKGPVCMIQQRQRWRCVDVSRAFVTLSSSQICIEKSRVGIQICDGITGTATVLMISPGSKTSSPLDST